MDGRLCRRRNGQYRADRARRMGWCDPDPTRRHDEPARQDATWRARCSGHPAAAGRPSAAPRLASLRRSRWTSRLCRPDPRPRHALGGGARGGARRADRAAAPGRPAGMAAQLRHRPQAGGRAGAATTLSGGVRHAARRPARCRGGRCTDMAKTVRSRSNGADRRLDACPRRDRARSTGFRLAGRRAIPALFDGELRQLPPGCAITLRQGIANIIATS